MSSNSKLLRGLNEGDWFSFPHEPFLRKVVQKGKTDSYCPRLNDNTSHDSGQEVFHHDAKVVPEEKKHRYAINEIMWHKKYGKGIITDIGRWPHYQFKPDLTQIHTGNSIEKVGVIEVWEDSLSSTYMKSIYLPTMKVIYIGHVKNEREFTTQPFTNIDACKIICQDNGGNEHEYFIEEIADGSVLKTHWFNEKPVIKKSVLRKINVIL